MTSTRTTGRGAARPTSGTRLLLRHVRHDLRGNPVVTAVLVTVLVLGAALMATGAMVVERLAGAVGGLAEQARPPHVLQMHKGPYDPAALERFAAAHDELEDWLVTELVGYTGSALTWQRPATGESGSLASSRVDHLFVTQNDAFDHLLDAHGAAPEPAPGDVWVPVRYQEAFGLRAGDTLTVATDDGPVALTVRGVVKDAQMAASASGSTRVLVSDADHARLLAGGGVPEIIVEYRLDDPARADALQRAYEADETLPRDGPTVTGQQIRLISTFSDGLAAMALVLVSALLVAVALLTLRFVILGTLEDEVREIGALRAVGVPDRTITRLYLARYVVLTLAACVLGGALAVLATDALTQRLRASYVTPPVGPWTVAVPVLALAAVFAVVVGTCRRVLGRVRRVPVVTALAGVTHEPRPAPRRRARRSVLASAWGAGVGRRLALLDLRADARSWLLLPAVFFLTAVLVAVPTHLLTTFEDPRFVTYLGAPQRDLSVEVQYQDDVDGVRRDVAAALAADSRVSDVQEVAVVPYRAHGPEGVVNLPVRVGDVAIRMTDGRAPRAGQVALSALNATELGVGVGDVLTVERDGTRTDVEVSGVYQDLTAGGKTARMSGDVTAGASAYTFYADVRGQDPAVVADDLQRRLPTAVVVPLDEYLGQTFSGTTDALRSATLLALALGTGVATLVTTLFLRLRLARDRPTRDALTALGFSSRELAAQVRTRTLLAVAAGTAAGLVFAATGGETLAGGLLVALQLSVSDLTFLPDPWLVHLLYPLLLVGAGLAGVALATPRPAGPRAWLRDREDPR